jgi:hypothetical protein
MYQLVVLLTEATLALLKKKSSLIISFQLNNKALDGWNVLMMIDWMVPETHTIFSHHDDDSACYTGTVCSGSTEQGR